MNQMRIDLSRIPACSIVALMFMPIGIIVLSISLSLFFDKIGENIFIDYGFIWNAERAKIIIFFKKYI